MAAVFPYAPLDVAVELYLNSGWTDVTSDVYARDKIRISRGRANEQSSPSPSTCQLTLDNRTGNYSTRNPVSPYYPSLGRNTPIRVAIRMAKDAYGRTVSGSWSTADVGGTWSTAGSGGTVQASDWNVGSGVGTLNVPVASAYRLSYLAGQLYRDVDVVGTVSVPFSNVTGGDLDLAVIMLSGLSTSDYFKVVLKVTSAEALTMSITHFDGTVVVADTAVGFVFAGQALRVRGQLDGQTMRGKVWAASGTEPYAWLVEGRSDKLIGRGSGWVGVRSGSGSGNTNVPVVFSWDNVEVRSNRFAGEISAFPPQWDVSGRDVYTQIEASGIRRRLSQGKSPLKGTYLRGNQTISPAHIAYWPVEDLSGATQIASGIGGSPMTLVGGTTTFATDSSFPGSAPIAKSNQTRWVGQVPKNSSTGQIQLVFLLSIPSTGEVDQATLAQIQTSGTAAFIDVFYQSGGGVKFAFYDTSRVAFHTSGTMLANTLNGNPVQLSVELTQNGGNVDYVCASLQPGSSSGLSNSGTATGCTIASMTGLFMNAYRQATSSAYGHVAVRNSITSIFTLANQLKAYAGENARTRVARLCTENSIDSRYEWDGAIESALMGAQGRTGLPDLLAECEMADMGSLHESRSVLGLLYRTRSSLYNQGAVLALDYAAGQVVPPWRPVEDDQALRNDVTVTRSGGSSFEAIQTTGRLAVTAPTVGTGVGKYDTSVTLNLYTDDLLQDAAGWQLNLGTVDEARYPTITVNMAKLWASNAQLALNALAVNLDDRVTVANPKALIAPGTISQLARGYTETLGGFEHEITYQCTPESPYEVVVLDSASMGKIDSDTSTLAGAATSGATTLYVTDTSGCGWTTSGGDLPIPITVGGEDMSVTAVSNVLLSNTGFESGLTPWTASGTSSFTQSSTQKHSGAFAGRLVPDGVSANGGPSSELIPVTGGASIAVSAWVWFTNTVTGTYSTSVNWFDSGSNYITTTSTFVSVSATTWTQVSNTFTAPANAAFAALVPVLVGTPAAGQIWYVDDASLTGPQKFTVTRSVNGVVKAQTAGTAVSLTRRAIIAL